MLRTFPALVLAASGVFGCESGGGSARTSQPTPVVAASAGVKSYGVRISAAPAEDLATVLREPERFIGRKLVLAGHVKRACTRKGCWMELAAGKEPSAAACRVTFEDYGFFVPTTSAGAGARAEGRIELVTVKASHVKHLEEEGATFARKSPDGSAQEVHFVASGVELTRRGS